MDIQVACLPRYTRFKAGHPAGFLEAFANLYWDIANCLDEFLKSGASTRSEYVYGVDHAVEGLVMLEAMRHSAAEICWVRVDL
ncbi:MAG: hypothetical protein EOM12_16420 [Verrucomicrobiae bacterium]|nr:hypothetical protein [Verrucomicrobiae bacterium]